MKDKAFLADADKAKMEVDPVTGEEMQRMIAGIYDTPAALVNKVAAAWRRSGKRRSSGAERRNPGADCPGQPNTYLQAIDLATLRLPS
jgi:hypothetical protein